jgi:hypothetical protein
MAPTLRRIAIAAVAVVLAGCGYYRVTDGVNGKTYVTNSAHMDRYVTGDAMILTDLRTGEKATVSRPRSVKITKAEADAEIAAAERSASTRPAP